MKATSSPRTNGATNVELAADSDGACVLQSTPILPRSAARLSLTMDFPGYCELLQPPVCRKEPLEAYTARRLYPALAITSDAESNDDDCYSMRPSSPIPPPLPPGFSLGSVYGTPQEYGNRSAPKGSRMHHRTSVDGAAAAEILNSCSAAEASVWQRMSGRATGHTCPREASAVGLQASNSAPAQLSELRFASNFNLARIHARYAALDALQELRYEAPGEATARGSSTKGRRNSSCSSFGRSSKSNCSCSNGKSSAESEGGGKDKDKEACTADRHAGLYDSRGSNSSSGGSGGSGGGRTKVTSRNNGSGWKAVLAWSFISVLASSTRTGGERGRAGWQRCKQLLWFPKNKKQHVSARGSHDDGGNDGAGEGDPYEGVLEPRLRPHDSRIIHRVRLGLDVRPQNWPLTTPSLFSRQKKDEDSPCQAPQLSGSGRSATAVALRSQMLVPPGRTASVTSAVSAVRRAWLRCKSMGRFSGLRNGIDGVAPEEAFTPICNPLATPQSWTDAPCAATPSAGDRCTAPAMIPYIAVTHDTPVQQSSSSLLSVRPLERQLTEPTLHRALAVVDSCTPGVPGGTGTTLAPATRGLRPGRLSSIWPASPHGSSFRAATAAASI